MDSKVEKTLAEAKNIDVVDGWFAVVALPNDIFALKETGRLQEVSSFLIIGSKKTILFDKGMGISNIPKVVRQLTDLERSAVV